MELREVRENPDIKKRGRTAVTHFCGWNTLEEMIGKCDEVAGALVATLFETGCRVSECLRLRGDMFEVKEDRVNVYGLPVLKKGRPATRNIPIRRDEALVPVMLQWVDDHPGYLFPSPYGETYSRQWAWYKITGADPSWWPHRIRSERATQLVIEYGFNVPQLMRFFNWSKPEEATEYVRLSVDDLYTQMRA